MSTTEEEPKFHIVRFPIPPSANRMYRRRGYRLHRSVEYLNWIAKCQEILKEKDLPSLEQKKPYFVEIYADIPYNRDLDNIIKPILDLLEKEKLTAQDQWCSNVCAWRLRDIPDWWGGRPDRQTELKGMVEVLYTPAW